MSIPDCVTYTTSTPAPCNVADLPELAPSFWSEVVADVGLGQWAAEHVLIAEIRDLVNDVKPDPTMAGAAAVGMNAAAARLQRVADLLGAAARRLTMTRDLVDTAASESVTLPSGKFFAAD